MKRLDVNYSSGCATCREAWDVCMKEGSEKGKVKLKKSSARVTPGYGWCLVSFVYRPLTICRCFSLKGNRAMGKDCLRGALDFQVSYVFDQQTG